MTQTRRNWYLAISLVIIAALLFVTTMGIVRTGGMIRIVCIILDVVWLYLTYEAIVNFAGKPKSEIEEESSSKSKS